MKIFLVCVVETAEEICHRVMKKVAFFFSICSFALVLVFRRGRAGPSFRQLTLRLSLSLAHARAKVAEIKSRLEEGTDVRSRGGGGGGGGGGRNSFGGARRRLRRDALVNSVSNADTLSETLERAHTTASETDDAGETILKSLSQQKHRLLSARAARRGMERDMESSEENSEDGIRKVHTEVDVARSRAVCRSCVGDVCIF